MSSFEIYMIAYVMGHQAYYTFVRFFLPLICRSCTDTNLLFQPGRPKKLIAQWENRLKLLKPVSHRTRLGTWFQYGVLGYTRSDW